MKELAFIVFLLGLVLCASVDGAERTWDGSAARDDGWTAAANWAGSVAPVAGDSLRFPTAALQHSNSNDYAPGTIFNAITYAGAGYTARGNRVALSNGVSVTHGSGLTVLYLPITLRDDQAFTVSQAGATLILNGDIGMGNNALEFTGSGNFTVLGDIDNDRIGFRSTVEKSGTGQLLFLQHASYGCPTVVNGGTLRVDYSLSNSTVTVNSGGTLLGLGKVEGLRVNSGGTMQPGAAVPDEFDVMRNAELNAGSIFRVRLNGTNAGSNYDQLRVGGTITLGGTLELIPGYVPIPGQEFTIIKNDGTNDIVGTFAGLPEGAEFTINGRPYRISYGGRLGGGGFFRDDDVTIEAIPAVAVWDGGALPNNLWSQPLNWVGDIIPAPGDDILFAHTNNSTLLTSNDFPAGRLFGSLVFEGTRSINIVGNPMQLQGAIRINGSGHYTVRPDMTLRGGIFNEAPSGSLDVVGAISLSGSQTFRATQVLFEALNFEGSVILNGFNLMMDNRPQVPFANGPFGPGTLTKIGTGALELNGAVTASIAINEGTLFLKDDAAVSSPIVVGNGGRLRARAAFHDLEVQSGGTFVPEQLVTSTGNVRLLAGSTLSVRIYVSTSGGAEFTRSTGFATQENHVVDISGCNLEVNVDSGASHSASVQIIYPYYNGDEVTGTFAGLPEGAIFVQDGRAFGITYRGGQWDNGVFLTSVTQFVWTGGGQNANWSTPGNWSSGIAPVPYSTLIFPEGAANKVVFNDFPANTPFEEIMLNGPYTVSGNRLAFGPITCNLAGEAVINADWGGGRIDISAGAAVRVEGSFGSVTKSNDGILRILGAGATGGSIRLQAGLVELGRSTANTVTGLTIEGGVVRLLEDHQVSDSATVIVEGVGQLDLSGQTEVIDELNGDGTVELSERLLRGGRLTVQEGDFSGQFVGTGVLTKTGGAILTLTGVSPFRGMTILEEGELRMDCVQTNSRIRLDGGLLTGRGFIGPLDGNLGGRVQPGVGGAQFDSALHTLDVSFNSTTTFRPVLTSSSPDFEGHELQVTGSVSLGGQLLVHSLFKPTNSASFTIIDNDKTDPVVGTFDGLPEGATVPGAGLLFRISYVGGSGNDVVLTRAPTPPATLRIERMPDGSTHVQGFGGPSLHYALEGTPTLNPPAPWSRISIFIANTNGMFQFFDGRPVYIPDPQFFYRAFPAY